MTTVACVWVKGHVPYTVVYVERLRAMVAKHLDRPFRFCCLTDRPQKVPAGIECLLIPGPGVLKGWWPKLQVFNAALPLSDRVLYLDLDTLIVGSLAPIVDFPAPFALAPHAGTFDGKDGRAVVKRFNSSVMVWDAGVNRQLFTQWRPEVAARLHGDQDWIGEQAPAAAVMPASWFPRVSSIGATGVIPLGAKVILAKTPKNIEAAKRWPWFADAWRAA